MTAYQYSTRAPYKIKITLDFQGKNITANGNLYSYNTISFAVNHNDNTVKLYLPNETIIECDNSQELEHFIKTNLKKERFAFIKVAGIKYGIIFPIVLIIIAGFYATYELFLPKLSKTIAMDIPKEHAYSIGKDTLEVLDKEYLIPSDLPIEHQNHLKMKLQAQMKHLKGLPKIKIIFRSSKDLGANAFALPNGTVVLLDDLVHLSSNDNELFTVVAHEIGHVYHRHALRQLIQSSVLYIGYIFLVGDVTSLTTIAGLLPVVLIQQHYSKEFELEADRYAYNLTKAHKIDPNNFIAILQKIKKSHKKDQTNKHYYLSSHPSIEERIKIFTH